MNKIYQENIKYIHSISRNIYEKVVNTSIETVKVNISKKGIKNIIKNHNGTEIHIHSSYNPYEQGKYLSEYAFEEDSDIILVFGLGLGYEFREIRKKDLNKKFYIVEPDVEVFKTMLQNVDCRPLLSSDGTIMLSVGQSYDETIEDLAYFISTKQDLRIRFVILPAYNHIYKDFINKLFKDLKNIIEKFHINFSTHLVFNDLWIQNFILNFKHLKNSYPVNMLSDSLKNIPAIIVGAGPSLAYNLEHLKKIYNKAIIVPCGSGVSVLEKNNIKGHIAGAMDGQKGEEDIFENLQTNKDINLFFSSQVYHRVPEKVGGKKFLINQTRGDNYISEFLDWNSFDMYSGFSITSVMAYNMACLGCNPIIFLGQDMCYINNREYVEGATFYSEIVEDRFKSGDYLKIKNKNGEDVYTNPPFLGIKYANEQIISAFPNIKFLNGTKDGLKILGADDIDFNEYVDKVMMNTGDLCLQYIIEEECEMFKNTNKNQVSRVENFIINIQQENEELAEICKEIIVLLDGLTINSEKIKSIIVKKEEELNNIMLYVRYIEEIASSIEVMYKNREELDAIKQIYSYILHKCNIIRKCIKYGDNVNLMEDEEETKTDI